MNRHARRAIFFDLDGIAAGSESVTRHVIHKFAASFGRTADSIEFDALDGSPAPILIAKVKREWGLTQRLDELLRLYDTLMDAALLALSPAPAAAATFDTASQNGWTLGIVTSVASARSRAWLARHGLAALVDFVVGGDDVCLGKPEPEPYLMASARSGCPRDATLAVEASLAGARSALAAGLRTFGLAPDGRAPIAWPDPIRLVGALDELRPELTGQRLRGGGPFRRTRLSERAVG